MPRKLIISPHPDDAVLSAWQAISDDAVVVTIFTGIPESGIALADWDRDSGAVDAAEQMHARRAEDTAALESRGARWIHLDFVDNQYRDGGGGPAPHRAIVDSLEKLVDGFDEIWLPAGIGGHPDHVAVARAALEVRGDHRRIMYADLPYATTVWAEHRDTEGAVSHLFDPTLSEIIATAPQAPPRLPECRRLTDGELTEKRAALECYATQLGQLERTFGADWDQGDRFSQEWTWLLPPARLLPPTIDLLPQRIRAAGSDEGSPFLTVLMRTQGTRTAPFRDALNSLANQTSHDFELKILAHDVSDEGRANIDAHVDALPEWLASATEIIPVHGGGRSRPLNTGLDSARGRYVAALDDDDAALPEWVAEFAALAERDRGKVLRARVAQVSMDGKSEPELFPEDFDFIAHFVGNESPICGLAYPRDAMIAYDLHFDESLDVVEDWDLLLRATTYFGVAVSPRITSHYRRWYGVDDSRSDHAQEVWAAAQRTVQDKSDDRPILLPPGSARLLRAGRHRVQELRSALDEAKADADADHRRLTLALSDSEAARANLQRELVRAEGHRDAVAAELDRTNAALYAITGSHSWRITAPLRAVTSRVRTANRGQKRKG